ncbi:MAG: MFS transporter [Dehalococcoidia bacterium]|nr:MFS transporter [Dehalococcoidia bacterium]
MKGVFYGWWIVLASFIIASYVAGTIFYGFTAFFEPIVAEHGWSYTQVSIASSLRGLEMGILAPVIGFVVDRFGSRKMTLFGVIIVGFGLIFVSLTHSLTMFYGAFLLLALGAGSCTSVVLTTAVANWFKRNIGKALGITACGFGAGGAFIPLIVWLIDAYDWRTALLILGLGMWTLGITLAFVIRDKPEQYGYLPDGDTHAGSTSKSEVQVQVVEVAFKEAIKGRTLWLIGLAEAIRFAILTAVVIHIMPYLSSIGISRRDAGLVATAVPLLSLIGRFGFGWLGDIVDKRYAMASTHLVMGLGMLALSYANIRWAILPFLLLFPLGYGGGMSLRGVILTDYFDRIHFGKALGIIMGISSIGGIIGPALAGWTFDTLGNYSVVWFAFSALTLVALPIILVIPAARVPDLQSRAQ